MNWFRNPVWRKKKSRTARAAFGARGFVLLISVQGHFQPHTGNNWILRQDSAIGLKWEKGRGKGWVQFCAEIAQSSVLLLRSLCNSEPYRKTLVPSRVEFSCALRQPKFPEVTEFQWPAASSWQGEHCLVQGKSFHLLGLQKHNVVNTKSEIHLYPLQLGFFLILWIYLHFNSLELTYRA